MTRTQIQLPDELYEQARRLAEQKEISLAEVVRRGLEHILRIHPPERDANAGWMLEPPANTQLRSDPFANPDWRVETSIGSAFEHLLEQRVPRRRKKNRSR